MELQGSWCESLPAQIIRNGSLRRGQKFVIIVPGVSGITKMSRLTFKPH